MAKSLTGYRHPLYIESLAEFGTPLGLPRSGGWLLRREVPHSPRRDAAGAYPLFSCLDWARLDADLSELEPDIVSVTLVADPFGDYEPAQLKAAFDGVRAFKEHYVADLTRPADERISSHHRRVVRRSMRQLQVEVCAEPSRLLDEWCGLYENTVARHNLSGIKAFSRNAFEKQLQVPGLAMFRATYHGRTVGMHLWYEQDDVAYGHLAGVDATGQRMAASYALYALASEWFTGRVNWLDLGGAPDDGDRAGGLRYFKAGWSTGTTPAFLCTRVCDQPAYDELAAAHRTGLADAVEYFPAYRATARH